MYNSRFNCRNCASAKSPCDKKFFRNCPPRECACLQPPPYAKPPQKETAPAASSAAPAALGAAMYVRGDTENYIFKPEGTLIAFPFDKVMSKGITSNAAGTVFTVREPGLYHFDLSVGHHMAKASDIYKSAITVNGAPLKPSIEVDDGTGYINYMGSFVVPIAAPYSAVSFVVYGDGPGVLDGPNTITMFRVA